MANPATSHEQLHEPLATVALRVLPRDREAEIVLPRAVWAHLFIGSHVVIETDVGDIILAEVELGDHERPVVVFDPRLASPDARRATVRLPRTA
jgi:hypothetical protein